MLELAPLLTLLQIILFFASTSALSASTAPSNRLRVIQINDVYELDCFPRLKTLIREKTSQDDNSIVVCAGDFLSPSLLSSLDKGASMVDTMNCVGITHVCFGNHEADVGIDALKDRIQQSTFTWMSSNLQLPMNNNLKVVLYDTVEVGPRQVALLGLLTEDPSLYRPGSFGGAKIDAVVNATQSLIAQMEDTMDVDLIVPLTHQSMSNDRAFCQHFPGIFPVVCGGHDHEIYDETVANNRILKAGMDATHAAIIDIQWDDTQTIHAPNINVEIMPTADFEPDPELVQRIEGHRKILENLQEAHLFRIADWMDDYSHNDFSTRNNRSGPSTGTSAIATMLRMGMRVSCAILNAGAVRGNADYSQQTFFTWSDLMAEMPFSTEMTAAQIPGSVLEATIAASRSRALENGEASGAYLHSCNCLQFNDETMRIESIRGEPFDSTRLYWTTLPALLLSGLDNHIPLLEWWRQRQQQPGSANAGQYQEMAIPAKLLIVEVFSSLLWLQLGSFDDIDRNDDGILSRDDVQHRVRQVYGNDAVADLVVNSIFSIADISNDGTITPLEMMIVQFCATDIVDHVCTQKELATLKQVASQVLGKDPSHDEVKRMVTMVRDTMDQLDGDIDGLIHRSEIMKAKGIFADTERNYLE